MNCGRVYRVIYETEAVTCRCRAAADSQIIPSASSSAASQDASGTDKMVRVQGYAKVVQEHTKVSQGHIKVTHGHTTTLSQRQYSTKTVLQSDYKYFLSFYNQVLQMRKMKCFVCLAREKLTGEALSDQ